MVLHVFKNYGNDYSMAEMYFDSRILIGRRSMKVRGRSLRHHSCLTICTKKKQMSEDLLGYRDYEEPNETYLYVKGVGADTVLLLAEAVKKLYDWPDEVGSLVKFFSRTH